MPDDKPDDKADDRHRWLGVVPQLLIDKPNSLTVDCEAAGIYCVAHRDLVDALRDMVAAAGLERWETDAYLSAVLAKAVTTLSEAEGGKPSAESHTQDGADNG